jgi:large subunit ribosomal protein L30
MFAVIRMVGNVGVPKRIRDTLKMLGLKVANNCVVLPETPSYKGMINKVKDYVTYGTINIETFTAMLEKRGRLEGDKRLTEEALKTMEHKSVEDLAKAIFEGKVDMKDTKLKRTFKLTPPKHGFKSTARQYPKGSLGSRSDAINEIIERMI